MSEAKDILKEFVTASLLLNIGDHAVLIIKKRVADGIFPEGSSGGSSQYSTKPFAMPLGAVSPKAVLLRLLKGKYGDDSQLFKSKKGRLWVTIKRGYKWYREQAGKPSNSVDMRWTGEMMRSLQVTKVDAVNGIVEISHRGARNIQLAKWHNEEGAGRSKKIRKWLLLTEDELTKIGKANI